MVFEPTFQPPYPIITAAEELQLVMDLPIPEHPSHRTSGSDGSERCR